MSLVRNQTSLQNFGYWIKYTTKWGLKTLFVLKCLDFYPGIKDCRIWGLGKRFRERIFLTYKIGFKDKNPTFVLLKYFASLHTFQNANCSFLKSCHGLERSFAAMQPRFLMWCLFSGILLPCLDVSCSSFWLHAFHAPLVCTFYGSIWSHNQDIVEDSGLPVVHRWIAN